MSQEIIPLSPNSSCSKFWAIYYAFTGNKTERKIISLCLSVFQLSEKKLVRISSKHFSRPFQFECFWFSFLKKRQGKTWFKSCVVFAFYKAITFFFSFFEKQKRCFQINSWLILKTMKGENALLSQQNNNIAWKRTTCKTLYF